MGLAGARGGSVLWHKGVRRDRRRETAMGWQTVRLKRRTVLAAGLIAPAAVRAQGKVYRIGILTPAQPLEPDKPPAKFLVAALAQRGYRLGENLTVTARGLRGQYA